MQRRTLSYSVLALFVAMVMAVVSARPAAAGNPGGTKVTGTVQSIDAVGLSFVLQKSDGTTLTVNVAVDFDFSKLAVGDKVEVTGTLNTDGSLAASRVKIFLPEADMDKLSGTILSLDPTGLSFVVQTGDGTSVTVLVAADFDFSKLAVGDKVEVEGILNSDGTFTATKVEVDDGQPEDGGNSNSNSCQNPTVQNPLGARLAERYGIDYATILGWYCQGYGWGEIMIALQISKVTGQDPLTLLQTHGAGAGWGRIWHDGGNHGPRRQPTHFQDNPSGSGDGQGDSGQGGFGHGNGQGHSGHGGHH